MSLHDTELSDVLSVFHKKLEVPDIESGSKPVTVFEVSKTPSSLFQVIPSFPASTSEYGTNTLKFITPAICSVTANAHHERFCVGI